VSELLAFRDFSEAMACAVPTIVAYDPSAAAYVIGERARQLVMSGKLGGQDFKHHVGDSDESFEGKISAKTARQEKR
jgi:hypothetical protein